MPNQQIVFPQATSVDLVDCEIPVASEAQVLVRTQRTLISTGTEMAVFSGKAPAGSAWDELFAFPHTPGYTNLGEVIDVGPGGDAGLVGRRIVSHGPHASWVAADLVGIRVVPDDVDSDDAIFFNLAEIAMNGVRGAGLRWGDSVAIYGAGILGQLTAQLCLFAGARRVFVVDVSDFRLGLLPQHPRLVGINSAIDDPVTVVRAHDADRLADIVIELTGNAELIPTQFAVLRDQGTMAVVSSPVGKTLFDFHDLCNRHSYRIVGVHNFSHPAVATPQNPWTNQRDAEFFFDLCRDGDLDLSRMISATVAPADAPSIYRQLLEDRSQFMGVVIDWSGLGD